MVTRLLILELARGELMEEYWILFAATQTPTVMFPMSCCDGTSDNPCLPTCEVQENLSLSLIPPLEQT